MDFIELLKSFMYLGDKTYGITIWLVAGFVICGMILYSNRVFFMSAFGITAWKRRFVARYMKPVVVKIDMPREDESLSNEDYRHIFKSVLSGIESFSDEYDVPTGLDVLKKKDR